MSMSSDDRTPAQSAKFLINRRNALAGAPAEFSDVYSRRLSQYGENAVEPAMRNGWNFGEA